jgi:hypothetical protein
MFAHERGRRRWAQHISPARARPVSRHLVIAVVDNIHVPAETVDDACQKVKPAAAPKPNLRRAYDIAIRCRSGGETQMICALNEVEIAVAIDVR